MYLLDTYIVEIGIHVLFSTNQLCTKRESVILPSHTIDNNNKVTI